MHTRDVKRRPSDVLWAAGAMLVPASSPLPQLVAAAAFVHAAISFFWVLILALVLPRRRVFLWAVLASALIGLLDLRVIAPLLFPEVARLAFWPQLADHLMWGRVRWRRVLLAMGKAR
jgi:hypothetical protein